ncbi:hypothetical protein NKH18_03940 [Streptomyces sp. M10(2022)]
MLAYIQAGATLWELGIRPEGIFGSGHDGLHPTARRADPCHWRASTTGAREPPSMWTPCCVAGPISWWQSATAAIRSTD